MAQPAPLASNGAFQWRIAITNKAAGERHGGAFSAPLMATSPIGRPCAPMAHSSVGRVAMCAELSTTFRVGKRYRCSISLPLRGTVRLEARWEPRRPTRLTEDELLDYRRGRDALLAEAARLLGGPVIVAEI